MDISEARAKLNSLDILKECENAFNANSEYSEDLNRQQLSQGVKSDGSLLPPYKPMTIMIKSNKGQQLDPMNLRDTEDYWKGMDHKASGGVIDFGNTDRKAGMLGQKFGEEIQGLNEDSIEKMIPRWQETLVENVKQQLGLL